MLDDAKENESLPTIIEKLKTLYPANIVDKKRKFLALWANTMEAIEQFAKEPNNGKFFEPNGASPYPKDKNCQINFTTLSVAIKHLMDVNVKQSKLNDSVKTLDNSLKELKTDLIVFLDNDPDKNRKNIYQTALDHINAILDLFSVENNIRPKR